MPVRRVRKTAAKKTATKRPAKARAKKTATKPKAASQQRVGIAERFEKDIPKVAAAMEKNDHNLKAAAKETGFGVSKVRRLHERSLIKPGERFFTQGLSREEMGKKVVELIDSGMDLFQVWARTGINADPQVKLYEEFSGKTLTRRRGRPASEKTAPAKKAATAKKSTAKVAASRGRKSRTVKKSSRKAG